MVFIHNPTRGHSQNPLNLRFGFYLGNLIFLCEGSDGRGVTFLTEVVVTRGIEPFKHKGLGHAPR